MVSCCLHVQNAVSSGSKSNVPEAHSNESEHSKHILEDGRLQVGQRGYDVGATVLVAPANFERNELGKM